MIYRLFWRLSVIKYTHNNIISLVSEALAAMSIVIIILYEIISFRFTCSIRLLSWAADKPIILSSFASRLKSIRRPIQSHDEDKVFLREASVKHVFNQSRLRHGQLRVEPWQVMYGERIPKTKMKKLEAIRKNDHRKSKSNTDEETQAYTKPFRF